jgi:hypothetical protein
MTTTNEKVVKAELAEAYFRNLSATDLRRNAGT